MGQSAGCLVVFCSLSSLLHRPPRRQAEDDLERARNKVENTIWLCSTHIQWPSARKWPSRACAHAHTHTHTHTHEKKLQTEPADWDLKTCNLRVSFLQKVFHDKKKELIKPLSDLFSLDSWKYQNSRHVVKQNGGVGGEG